VRARWEFRGAICVWEGEAERPSPV